MPVSLRSRGLRRRSVRHPDLMWRAEAMLEALGLEEAELSILLCDDATMRKLNRRYRSINRTTDVLAFSMQDPSEPTPVKLLGDVVISLPTATEQARAQGRTIVDEVTFLLAHGLLHLLGYDHATDAEAREMANRSERLLEAVKAARPSHGTVEKP